MANPPRFRIPPLVTLAAAMTVGCYAYAPISPSEVAPGTAVRVNLSDAGSAAVATSVGAYATALDGPVTFDRDSALVVSVIQLTRRGGGEETWGGEAVRVPRTGVASFEVRRLSRSRTGVLIGGGAAVGVAVGVALGGGGGFGGRTGGPPSGGTR